MTALEPSKSPTFESLQSHGFLEELRCPACGGTLAVAKLLSQALGEIRYGILACACARYPIVEGIIILRAAVPSERVDFVQAARCIERGDTAAALACCLAGSVGAPRRPILGALERLSAGRLRTLTNRRRGVRIRNALAHSGLTFQEALARVKANLYRDYLYQRFANPSLHAAVPVIALLNQLRGQRVLDLACGMGHSTFLIKSLFPDLSVVMADHDFTNLYLARRFFAPSSPAICLDAEGPLPFADASFDAVFCMDAFHYIARKSALARQMDRLVDADGMILLAHLHNALAANPVPGAPLAPSQYLELWAARPARAISEPQLLRDFVHDGALKLDQEADPQSLDNANAIAIVCGQPARLWRRHDVLDTYLRARPLGLNPLYRLERGPSVELRMDWRNPQLHDECRAACQYMPQVRKMSAAVWDQVASGTAGSCDRATLHALQRQFVLVPLPENYG